MRKQLVGLLVGCVYVALTLALGSLSFGPVQFRFSELLVLLCLFEPFYILPLTFGCFLANFIGFLGGFSPLVLDLFIGPLASFLSCYLLYRLAKFRFLGLPLLAIGAASLVEGMLIGGELALYYGPSLSLFLTYTVTVTLGELGVFALGLFVLKPLERVARLPVDDNK